MKVTSFQEMKLGCNVTKGITHRLRQPAQPRDGRFQRVNETNTHRGVSGEHSEAGPESGKFVCRGELIKEGSERGEEAFLFITVVHTTITTGSSSIPENLQNTEGREKRRNPKVFSSASSGTLNTLCRGPYRKMAATTLRIPPNLAHHQGSLYIPSFLQEMQEVEARSQEIFTMDRKLVESLEWRIFRMLVEAQSDNLGRRVSIVESPQHSDTEVSVEGFVYQVKQAGQAIQDFQKKWSLVKEKFYVNPDEVTLWKSLKKTMNLLVWRVKVSCMLEQKSAIQIYGPHDIVKAAMYAIDKVLCFISSYKKGAFRPNSFLATHPKVIGFFQSVNDLNVFVWKGDPSNLRQDATLMINYGDQILHHNISPGIISSVSHNSMALFKQCVPSNRRAPQTIFHLIFNDAQTDQDNSTRHLLTEGIIHSLERAAQDNFHTLAIPCCGLNTTHVECIVLAIETFFRTQPHHPLRNIAFVAEEDTAIAKIQNVCLKHWSQRENLDYLLPKVLLSLEDVKTEVVSEPIKEQKTNAVVIPFVSQGSRISPLCHQSDSLCIKNLLGSLSETEELPVGEAISIPATHIQGVSCQVLYIIQLDENLVQENRAKEAIHQLVHGSLLTLYSSFFESITIPLLESDSLGDFSRDRVLQTMLEEIDQFTKERPSTWIRSVKVVCPPDMVTCSKGKKLIDENLSCAEALGFFVKDNPVFVRYLDDHRATFKTFESNLQRHHCRLRICQQQRILQFIPVNSHFPNRRLLFSWWSSCEATFQAMRCDYSIHYEKDAELLSVLHEHPSVLNQFPSLRRYEDICLVGLQDEVRRTQKILNYMVFQKKQITSQLLVPHMLRCIIAKDVIENELEISCPKMTIDLNEDLRIITFEGLCWQVALLERRFQELLNAFHSIPLSISSYQSSFIQAFGLKNFSRRFFMDRDIPTFLELLPRSGDMSGLGIFGLNSETLRAAEKRVQSLIFQTNVEISEAAVCWVADVQWQTLMQSLEEEGKIAVHPAGSANGALKEVVLVGFEPYVSKKEAILKEFLQDFSPVEERMELTRQELVDAGKDLLRITNWRNLNVITEVVAHHGTASLVVRGLRKHVCAARAIIRADLHAITLDTVPITSILWQYFEKSGAEILQKLSQELQCIIQSREGPPGGAMPSLKEQKMVPQEGCQSLMNRWTEEPNDAGYHARAATVCIIGRSNEVAKAKEAIHIFSERYWEETITSPFVPAIQEDKWNCIMEMPSKFPLKWLLCGNSITIQGAFQDVIKALKVIQKHLHKKELRVAVTEELSKSVQWYYENNPRYLPFDPEANYQLETRYRKQKKEVEVFLGAERALIDLERRKASLLNTALKIERRVHGSEPDIPRHWELMQDCLSKRVELQVTSEEYKNVANRFHQTAENHVIIKIERIQNTYLWHSFRCKRSWLERKNPPGLQNERLLFHGTRASTCNSIQEIGFNSRFNQEHLFGKGVYFAKDASVSISYSSSYNGTRTMFLARVLTGRYTKGEHFMMLPPADQDGSFYDSVVNCPNNPTIFVSFFDDFSYPEHLITFQ